MGVEARGSAEGLITLWNEDFFKSALPGPWIIGGDFKTVLDQCERKGGLGSSRSINNFRRFVDCKCG
ncbi:hypothetical protein Ddye_029269 [Dipteronia dyeriana]|uniref:Uncharacterized protein n=1 Tax=Dipteronia dyeriana TaxID=168575 RepID=A0AAD9TE91_9ROSI|nr:hypothetical protein Ddye_029269 [Dipteronia dyeriana]